MNDVGSTLVAQCGARKVTREELKEFPYRKPPGRTCRSLITR